MNKQNKGFAPILILLVVVAVIGVIILAGKGKLGSTIKIGTPVPVATSDPTANWKTYTNTKYSFSIKYPSDWTIVPRQGSTFDLSFFPQVALSQGEFDMNIYPDIDSEFSRINDPTWPGIRSVIIAGRSARELSYSQSGAYLDIRIDDLHGLKWTKLNLITYTISPRLIQFVPTANEIISTFKFIQ